MTKEEFLSELSAKLAILSDAERKKTLAYYREMIEDRMEDGMSEAEAVAAMGDIDGIVRKITLDQPFSTIVKEKFRSASGLKWWHVALIILGFPLWFSLLASLGAGVFSVCAGLLAAVIGVVAAFAAAALGGMAAVVAGIVYLCRSNLAGLALLGAGFFAVGLSMLTFWGARYIFKWCLGACRRLTRWVKSLFVKRGKAA